MSDAGNPVKASVTAGEDDCTGTEVVIVEGFGKFRDVKRWKQRYCVLTKLSPAAGTMTTVIAGIWMTGLLIFAVVRPGIAFRITVDAYEEECFFERVDAGTKLGLTFEVVEGGFLDIDLRVIGPDGDDLIIRDRESSGKVAFAATKDGNYTYCFSNKMSTVTPKEVMFSIDVGDINSNKKLEHYGNYTSEEVEQIQPEKFGAMIAELRSAILAVKHEQEYMEVRDKIHHKINDSTNFNVCLWAFFESIMILSMSICQAFYIIRFFEVRRII